MKDKIHPEYKPTTIMCACGAVINTRSTKQNIKVDICSSCHPFFTGQQKLVDSAGMVEKFQKRYTGKVHEKKSDVKKAAPAQPQSAPKADLSTLKKPEDVKPN